MHVIIDYLIHFQFLGEIILEKFLIFHEIRHDDDCFSADVLYELGIHLVKILALLGA